VFFVSFESLLDKSGTAEQIGVVISGRIAKV